MKSAKALLNIRGYIAWAVLAWTVFVGIPFSLNIYQERQLALEFAKVQAQSYLSMDLVYRHWNASFGGIYVPVTEMTQPNPYLKVPNRDVTTTTGIELTLINPAYMMRQVHELGGELNDERRHITSLNPIRPQNAPDAWETEALKAFENGVTEVSSVETSQDIQYLRLMIPLITEEACLKCHAIQGYKVGDIRGGLSVSVSLTPYLAGYQSNAWKIALGYGLLWVLGVAAIFTTARRIEWQMQESKRAEDALRESESIFASFMEYSPVYIFFKDKEIRSLRLSRNYEQMLGMPVSQILGKRMDELFPSDLAKSMVEDDLRILNEGQQVDVVEELGGRVYETTKFPIFKDGKPNMLAGFTLDITERKLAEVEHQVLLEIMQKAVITKDLQDLLRIIHHYIGRVIYADNFFVVLYNKETGFFEEVYSVDQFDPPEMHPAALKKSLSAYVFRTGEPFLFTKAEFEELVGRGEVELVGTSSPSWLGVPLKTAKETIGVMVVQDYERPNRFQKHDADFLASVAVQVALVVERNLADAALRESEEKFRKAFLTSPDSVNINRLQDGKYVSINPGFTEIMGYSETDTIGRTSLEIQIWDNPEDRKRLVDGLKKNGEVHNLEARFRCKDGSFKYGLMSASVIELNGVSHILSITRDITERKHAEDALSESESRYRAFFEQGADGVVVLNPETGQMIEFNDQACNQLGYTREEFSKLRVVNVEAMESAEEVQQHINKIMADGHDDFETQHRTKHGEIRNVQVTAQLIVAGRRSIYHCIWRDITEQRQAYSALRRSELFSRSIIENEPECVKIVGAGGILNYMNPAGLAMIEVDDLAVVAGHSVYPIVVPEHRQAFIDLTQNVLRGERGNLQFEIVGLKGTRRWLDTHAVPLFDEQGNVEALLGLTRDITEQKHAEAALRESENLYRKMNENSPLGMHFYKITNDNQLIFVDANPAADNLLGVDNSQFKGKTIEEAFPLLIQTEIPERYRDAAKNGIPWSTEQIDYNDVQIRGAFEVRAFQTTPGNMVAVFADVTARKQMEEALRESEERFRTLYDNATIGLYRTTPVGRILMLNPAGVRMLGFDSFDEIAQRDLENPEFHVGSPRKDFSEKLEREGTIFGMEREMLKKDGSIIFVRESAKIIRSENGEARYYDGSFEDITARKRAEDALRESEERFRRLANNAPDIIFRYDFIPEMKLTFINPAVEKTTYYTPAECYADPLLMLNMAHPDDAMMMAEYLQSRQPPSDPLNMRWLDKYGATHWMESRLVPIYDEANQLVAVEGITRDTTDRKLADLEREKLITELSAKNAELERFTYTVSHDLKSPIVTIRGFLGYLTEDAHTGNTVRMENDIQRITKATDKMQDLLRDLLELSRIGRMMNTPETIHFEDLLRDALDIVHGQIEERQIAVLTQPNLPTIHGDRQRLTEVLQNLLDNAIKYMGDQPSPSIEIGQRGKEDGKPVFFVKDNGIGIAPEYHERIFGLFNKLDPLSDGTGIGLALVKRIIEVHGGRIWVESELGKGSTFYFSLQPTRDA